MITNQNNENNNKTKTIIAGNIIVAVALSSAGAYNYLSNTILYKSIFSVNASKSTVPSKKTTINDKIIEQCPYEIEKMEYLELHDESGKMNVVNVYTTSEHKDTNLLLSSSEKVIKKLPENYYVRYI